MRHAKCEVFARLRASELMSRARGAQNRIQRATLCRLIFRMVGFMAIRGASVFARIGRIWACLVSYFHAFLALRALSGEMTAIAYDS